MADKEEGAVEEVLAEVDSIKVAVTNLEPVPPHQTK